jgi:hypothetical protein
MLRICTGINFLREDESGAIAKALDRISRMVRWYAHSVA